MHSLTHAHKNAHRNTYTQPCAHRNTCTHRWTQRNTHANAHRNTGTQANAHRPHAHTSGHTGTHAHTNVHTQMCMHAARSSGLQHPRSHPSLGPLSHPPTLLPLPMLVHGLFPVDAEEAQVSASWATFLAAEFMAGQILPVLGAVLSQSTHTSPRISVGPAQRVIKASWGGDSGPLRARWPL